MLPKIESYGQYSSDNYGAHTRKLTTSNITIWYSYETIVAYRDEQDGLVVVENCWGPTTGNHLTWIDGGSTEARKSRLPRAKFSELLAAAQARHGL